MTILAYTVLTNVKGYNVLADIRKLKANIARKSEKKINKKISRARF